MTWFGWLLIAFWSLSAVTAVNSIGKPRPPLTPNVASGVLVIIALLMLGTILVGTNAVPQR